MMTTSKTEKKIKFADILIKNPFTIQLPSPTKSDCLESEIGEEIKAAPISKSNIGRKKPSINFNDFAISTSGLNIIRIIGKYYEMINLIPICSSDVLPLMVNVISYYVYSVMSLFMSPIFISNLIGNSIAKSTGWSIDDLEKKSQEIYIKSMHLIRKIQVPQVLPSADKRKDPNRFDYFSV
jgi:hypothetical protein